MKRFYVFIGFIFFILLLFLIKLSNSGNIRIGKVDYDFPKLENGTYEVKNLKIKLTDLSIYCLEGSGKVFIDGIEYSLNDEDYKEASKQNKQVKYAVLYENSKKIKLNEDSKIVVDGIDNFKISFLTR